MTYTKHTQSARTRIALGAAAGLALVAGITLRADDRPHAQRARVAAETSAIAEWATAQGMSGLSPASLRIGQPSDADLEARIQLERTAIAEWARAQNLTGLSPASLAPLGN
jgi:hypothetical protein